MYNTQFIARAVNYTAALAQCEYSAEKQQINTCIDMAHDFELAKYQGKWAVFDKTSRTYSHIGRGKKFCQEAVKELNTLLK